IARESIASGAARGRLNNLVQSSKNLRREAIYRTTILDKMIKEKQKEDLRLKKQPFNYTDSSYTGPTFAELVQKNKNMSMIAEIKRASPSKGLINGDVDPAQQAKVYEANGASAISVLTDAPFFQGTMDDLKSVREAV